MSCKECEERRRLAREALLRSAVGEAAVHVVKGAAELVGIKKKKTATADRKKAVAKRKSGAAGKRTGSSKPAQE